MIPLTCFHNHTIAVFGLGGSGLVSAKALMAGGAKVSAYDDNAQSQANAEREGIPIVDLRNSDFRQFSALVLSPGVPLTHPEPHWSVQLARAANCPVIGDIDLFCCERALVAPDSKLICITGTNGKSTTTALIAHVLKQAGFNVAMGGNIGIAALDLPPPDRNRVHVLECSSFQIDLAPSLNPTHGVLLNITPDHLDRHSTMENYAAIKARLVAMATELAVIGVDDDHCLAIADKLAVSHNKMVRVTQEATRATKAHDIVITPEKLLDNTGAELVDLRHAPNLRGLHNGQNAAACFAVARALGLSLTQIQQGFESYQALAHRMQQVGEFVPTPATKILFVNDSKATNAEATQHALRAYKNIYWIVGGQAKEGGIESLKPLFSHITKAYVIGAAQKQFAETLQGALPFACCSTLDVALNTATHDAMFDSMHSEAQERVILLSPACASKDQFKNFEARGDFFTQHVQKILASLTTQSVNSSHLKDTP